MLSSELTNAFISHLSLTTQLQLLHSNLNTRHVNNTKSASVEEYEVSVFRRCDKHNRIAAKLIGYTLTAVNLTQRLGHICVSAPYVQHLLGPNVAVTDTTSRSIHTVKLLAQEVLGIVLFQKSEHEFTYHRKVFPHKFRDMHAFKMSYVLVSGCFQRIAGFAGHACHRGTRVLKRGVGVLSAGLFKSKHSKNMKLYFSCAV